ncbi:MAG: tetratricopeptide repeat protein [Comamonadaceae bacterium]|nr:tetratricopeptide repeat protein [Comamonadaceae bacterium]
MMSAMRVAFAALLVSCACPMALAQVPIQSQLERATTLEQSGDFDAAENLYKQVLELDSVSRPALLGLARVARAQYRLHDARTIYDQMLQRDPQDIDAQNGMAWIALANYQTDTARNGFNAVLAREPANAEAAAGLAGTDATHRFHMDVVGSRVHNETGSAWGGGVSLKAALDARNSFELGLHHNSRELLVANQLDPSRLPSNVLRLGYRWQVPGDYGLGLVYENRDRKDSPTEQRLELSVSKQLNQRWEVFGAVRKSFGPGWGNRLVQAGATVSLVGPWALTTTLYSGYTPDFGHSHAVVADLFYRNNAGAMLVLGASHGTNPNFNDVHGRAVIPVGRNNALLVTARYNSFKRESELELGWRLYWK